MRDRHVWQFTIPMAYRLHYHRPVSGKVLPPTGFNDLHRHLDTYIVNVRVCSSAGEMTDTFNTLRYNYVL
jgi:hypothetical protein